MLTFQVDPLSGTSPPLHHGTLSQKLLDTQTYAWQVVLIYRVASIDYYDKFIALFQGEAGTIYNCCRHYAYNTLHCRGDVNLSQLSNFTKDLTDSRIGSKANHVA